MGETGQLGDGDLVDLAALTQADLLLQAGRAGAAASVARAEPW